MQLLRVAGVFCAASVFACEISADGSQQASLQDEVNAASGGRPVDCGYVLVPMAGPNPTVPELAKMVQCVVEHASAKELAWMRVSTPGVDSRVYYGLFSTKDGLVRIYTYDSDPSGGGGAPSAFSHSGCSAPQAAASSDRGGVVVCGPK
jgi:hypothetical protein